MTDASNRMRNLTKTDADAFTLHIKAFCIFLVPKGCASGSDAKGRDKTLISDESGMRTDCQGSGLECTTKD